MQCQQEVRPPDSADTVCRPPPHAGL